MTTNELKRGSSNYVWVPSKQICFDRSAVQQVGATTIVIKTLLATTPIIMTVVITTHWLQWIINR